MKLVGSVAQIAIAGCVVKIDTKANHIEIQGQYREIFSGSYEAFQAECGVDFTVDPKIAKEIHRRFN